jgi:D-glycerate 3-kinase
MMYNGSAAWTLLIECFLDHTCIVGALLSSFVRHVIYICFALSAWRTYVSCSSTTMAPFESVPAAVPIMVKHVLEHHHAHVTRHKGTAAPPLIVGVQGPQGSGKSFLSGLLRDHLSTSSQSLRAVVLSVDDLYLPHAGLREVAQASPSNPLLQGRGQPGTHDVLLGTKLLHEIRSVNTHESARGSDLVMIPSFDKSMHGGEGDRVPEQDWTAVQAPLDVLIFEGWFVGFDACSSEELERHYAASVHGLEGIFDLQAFCKATDVREISERLAGYQAWWNMLDVLVQLSPQGGELANVYKWRLQQEHAMKAKNGGKGMSDEQVKRWAFL